MDTIITISSDSSAPNSPIAAKNECSSLSDDDKTMEYFPSVESSESEHELEIAASCASKFHGLSSSDDSDSQHTTEFSDDNFIYSNNVCASSLPQSHVKDDVLLPDQIELKTQKPKKTKIDRAAALESKEEKKAQREQKKLENAQNKALKQAIADSRRMQQPGECLKYINVMLDNQILMEPHGGGILSVLSEMNVQYTIQEQIVPLSISWVCESKIHSFDNEMKLQVNSAFQEADEVVLVWHWSKVANEINSNEFIVNFTSLASLLPEKKITLIIYGTKEYFRTQKGKHGKMETDSNNGNKNKGKVLPLPKVTKQKLEMELAELQISYNCNYRFIDSPDHLGSTIAQCTKAIAERPFKLEKNQRSDAELEWFALGDSRDCVKVDKNGNGLARLWKQQLCQFNLATLATAEAIVSVYSSPKALIEAYKQCSSRREAELLLQDIPSCSLCSITDQELPVSLTLPTEIIVVNLTLGCSGAVINAQASQIFVKDLNLKNKIACSGNKGLRLYTRHRTNTLREIRRGAGPLATSQRIGPVLSRQICICFTATDGDETLGTE